MSLENVYIRWDILICETFIDINEITCLDDIINKTILNLNQI